MYVSIEGKFFVTLDDGTTQTFKFHNERELSVAKRTIRAMTMAQPSNACPVSSDPQTMLDLAVQRYLMSGRVVFTKDKYDSVFGGDLCHDFEKWSNDHMNLPVRGGRNRLYSAIESVDGVRRVRGNNRTQFRFCKLASSQGGHSADIDDDALI